MTWDPTRQDASTPRRPRYAAMGSQRSVGRPRGRHAVVGAMDSVWLLILVMPLLVLSVWQVSTNKPAPRRRALRVLAIVGAIVTLLFVIVRLLPPVG